MSRTLCVPLIAQTDGRVRAGLEGMQETQCLDGFTWVSEPSSAVVVCPLLYTVCFNGFALKCRLAQMAEWSHFCGMFDTLVTPYSTHISTVCISPLSALLCVRLSSH